MSIERDELARDIFVAGHAVRMTPREAFNAAEAFVREREAWQVVPKAGPAPVQPGSGGPWVWGTASGAAWHLWREGCAEALCGETCDEEIRWGWTADDEQPSESACSDCRDVEEAPPLPPDAPAKPAKVKVLRTRKAVADAR